MNPRAEEVFFGALDVEDGAREAYLQTSCGEDTALRKEVDELLYRRAQAVALLQGSVGQAALEWSGLREVAGPYRLVKELGRGGMGSVWAAERCDGELTQRVAIKVLRRGLDTDDILSRFRLERQILANLQHRHIAHLLDAGMTSDGRPFLAMEHIDGEPLDAYCQKRQLPLRKRLELFRDVCSAVQYAHQNLVVHRDIKMSNILVTAEGDVKLLDFGIAKLLTDTMDATRTQARLMTPEYASPEQVRGEAVTTATDVYSLGVLLYELVAGAHPYLTPGRESFQWTQAVLETEPARHARLKGDLEAIARHALRKDARSRYQSVEQLSDDVRRYLSGEPVLARKDTPLYRARKFVSRHEAVVITAAVVVLTLAGGIVATRRQAKIAEQERNRAYEVLSFLKQVVGATDAEASSPIQLRADATLLDLMNAAAKGLDSFTKDPKVEAELRTTIGNAYRTLEKWDLAEIQLSRASSIQKRSGASAERAQVERSLAQLAFRKGDLARAKELDLEALRIWDAMGSSADPKEQSGTLNEIATILLQQDRAKDALHYVDRAQEIVRANPNLDQAWVCYGLGVRARAYGAVGERERAEPLYRDAIACGEKLGSPPPNSLSANVHNLAVLIRPVNPKEAERLLERAVALRTATYGAGNNVTLASLVELELTRARMGRVADAERALRNALDQERRSLPEGHYEITRVLRNLGETLRLAGQYREAATLLKQAVDGRLKIYGPDSVIVADSQAELAMALAGLDRKEEARALLREALRVTGQRYAAGHPALTAIEAKLRTVAESNHR